MLIIVNQPLYFHWNLIFNINIANNRESTPLFPLEHILIKFINNDYHLFFIVYLFTLGLAKKNLAFSYQI
jgi:hypothetical protein